MGDGSCLENSRAMSLEGSTLPLPLYVPLAERLRRRPSKLERRVRFPQGTLESRGSASGRLPDFESGDGGSNPPPRTAMKHSGAVAVGRDDCSERQDDGSSS